MIKEITMSNPGFIPDLLVGDFNVPLSCKDSHRFVDSKPSKIIREYIDHLSIQDIAESQHNYEHTFFSSRTSSRIDRMFGSKLLYEHCDKYLVGNTPLEFDHKFILASFFQSPKPMSKIWRFNSILLSDPHSKHDISTIIEKVITTKDATNTINQQNNWIRIKRSIISKIKHLQSKFHKERNEKINEIKDLHEKKSENIEKLLEIKKQLSVYNEKLKEFIQWRYFKELFKSKCNISTKYLQKYQQRFTINEGKSIPISSLFNHFNLIFNNDCKSDNKFVDKLFSEWKTQINEEENNTLVSNITEKEVELAISKSNFHSSPGPDGIPYSIYIKEIIHANTSQIV